MSSFAACVRPDIADLLHRIFDPKPEQAVFRNQDPSGTKAVILYEPIGSGFYTIASPSPWGFAPNEFYNVLIAARPQFVWAWIGPRRRRSLDELIDECLDPENLEENEAPPSAKAVGDLKDLISNAALAGGADLPIGDVAPYFGEISITWRNGHNMRRMTSLSDARTLRVDYGTTP
jgi:hypothetical protein